MDRRVFACITIATTIVSGSYLPLTFKENGREYTEVVRTDMRQNTVELQVPAHGSIHPLGVLNDFATGYSAKKDYQENVCYISAIEKGFPTPEQMEKNMQMTQEKDTNNQYHSSNVKVYPIRNMTKYEVGPKIAAFCDGYHMVLVAEFNNENVEEELGKLVRGEVQDARMKRQVYPTVKVKEWENICDGSLTERNFILCPRTYNLRCQWLTTNCYYYVTCFAYTHITGHVCQLRHPHIVTRRCCDIVCP